jgi:hypothetical protein
MEINIKILNFKYGETNMSNMCISYLEFSYKNLDLSVNQYVIWFDIHKRNNKIVSYIDIENKVINQDDIDKDYHSLYFSYYN